MNQICSLFLYLRWYKPSWSQSFIYVTIKPLMVAGHSTATFPDQNSPFIAIDQRFFFLSFVSCTSSFLPLVPSLVRSWLTWSKWGRSPTLCPNKASTNLCSGPPHRVPTVTPVQCKSKTPTRGEQFLLSARKCMWHPSTSRKPSNSWSSLTCGSLFQITFCLTYRRPWKSMRRIPAGNLWKKKKKRICRRYWVTAVN